VTRPLFERRDVICRRFWCRAFGLPGDPDAYYGMMAFFCGKGQQIKQEI